VASRPNRLPPATMRCKAQSRGGRAMQRSEPYRRKQAVNQV
jgi:hypothetical protein